MASREERRAQMEREVGIIPEPAAAPLSAEAIASIAQVVAATIAAMPTQGGDVAEASEDGGQVPLLAEELEHLFGTDLHTDGIEDLRGRIMDLGDLALGQNLEVEPTLHRTDRHATLSILLRVGAGRTRDRS